MSIKFKGFNLVELSIVVSILAVFFIALILIVNPGEYKQKAYDSKRISEISKLYAVIAEYKLKNGVYPGVENKEYVSNISYAESLTSANYGWIEANLSDFLQIQYIDPVNTNPYVYKYIHNETDFELNSTLQNNIKVMQNDKGNNDLIFEMGTDLELLN